MFIDTLQDTYFKESSLQAIKAATSATLKAVTALVNGDYNAAFCAIRPPGDKSFRHEVLILLCGLLACFSTTGLTTSNNAPLPTSRAPAGHHAGDHGRVGDSSGFCLNNHVVVALRYLLEVVQLKRVLIVDCDAHLCEGELWDPLVAFENGALLHAFRAFFNRD